MEDSHGLTFQCLHAGEAEFLYEEIFTRRSYLQHGVHIPPPSSPPTTPSPSPFPTIVDVGANIGLFSLLALRENPCSRLDADEVCCMPSLTLSSLLEEAGVEEVELLKVVVEVHDINGRLHSITSLLRRHGYRVVTEPQRGGVVRGYEMVVPDELKLWLVFAVRREREVARTRQRPAVESELRKPRKSPKQRDPQWVSKSRYRRNHLS
ncbi:MAG: hypothetical protein SGPRY_014469 [Prymnesium sp.]